MNHQSLICVHERTPPVFCRLDGEANVPAPEYVLHKIHGYEAAPRRPLLPLDESQGEALMKAMKPLLDLEAKMERSEY